jgi:hypothetical protein
VGLIQEWFGQDPEITAPTGQAHDFVDVSAGFAELLEKAPKAEWGELSS